MKQSWLNEAPESPGVFDWARMILDQSGVALDAINRTQKKVVVETCYVDAAKDGVSVNEAE